MQARALSAAEAAKLFEPLSRHRHLALAVSGGPDSLALLFLIARWRAERGARPGVTVLSVDHGLRPGSRGEAETVAAEAAKLGVPHAILTWESPPQGAGAGLQERARAARYDLMAGYCHAHDIPALLTAHHLDDQAETLLMRLKRGSGLDGLAAIPEESVWAGLWMLRPLLDVPKARLTATLVEAGMAWFVDPSNADRRFERARLRASREALAKLGLAPQALALSAKRLRRARAALDRAAEDFLAAHVCTSPAGYSVFAPEALTAAPAEIALRALQRVLVSIGGRPEPIRLSKLEALLSALRDDGCKTHTLGGCRIAPITEGVGVFREARKQGLPELELKPGERALWDNRFTVSLGAGESRPASVRGLGKDAASQPGSPPWLQALPRFARIGLPAFLRDGIVIFPRLGSPAVDGEGFQANFVGMSGARPRHEEA